MFNTVPIGNPNFPVGKFLYVVTADANADTVIEVSLTSWWYSTSSWRIWCWNPDDYEGGQVLTDSRLQVGLFFRSFNSRYSQLYLPSYFHTIFFFFRILRLFLVRANVS